MTCSLCRQTLDDRGHCPTHGARDPASEGNEATEPRDLVIGRQIGEWTVRRRIGAGGMGIVYEAWQPTIERRVAIKILKSEPGELGSASGLIAEARAANAIGHRGIIDIFSFGRLEGVGPYIVMEYLEGSPLDEVVHLRAPLSPRETARILDEILSALAAAHARGVIHRDLKPSNVFLVNDPAGGYYVKLLDFGLAKRSEVPHGTTPQTRTSVVVGTPEYMAPEQAMGKAVGPHTDLYALGIIAFEMLTGKLPFEADSAFGMAMHQVNTPAPTVESFNPSVPSGLSELVADLLEKEPGRRPRSAQEVRNRLQQLASDLPDVVGQPEPVEQPAAAPATEVLARSRKKKVPLPAAIGGGVLVLALAVAGALLLRSGSEQIPVASEPVVESPSTAREEAPSDAPVVRVDDVPIATPPVDVEPESPPEPAVVTAESADEPESASRPASVKPAPARTKSGSRRVTPKPAAARPAPTTVAAVQPVPPPPPPLPPPPSEGPGEGRLRILLEGWADLKIDGVSRGRLKPEEITLPAGRHVIELINPYKAPYRTEVVVEKDKTRVLEAVLEPLGQ